MPAAACFPKAKLRYRCRKPALNANLADFAWTLRLRQKGFRHSSRMAKRSRRNVSPKRKTAVAASARQHRDRSIAGSIAESNVLQKQLCHSGRIFFLSINQRRLQKASSGMTLSLGLLKSCFRQIIFWWAIPSRRALWSARYRRCRIDRGVSRSWG